MPRFLGRLGVEATYYNKRMNDALVPIDRAVHRFRWTQQPQSLGEPGHHRQPGLQVVPLGTSVSTRPISWDVRLTASTNQNELVSFGGRDEPINFGSFRDRAASHSGIPRWPGTGRVTLFGTSGRPLLERAGPGGA